MLTHKLFENYIIFAFEGRLDMTIMDEMEEEIIDILAKEKKKDIIVNMSKLEYMSTTGLRVLVTLLRKLKVENGTLKLCHLQNAVVKVFEGAQMKSLFDIYDTEAECLN